MARRKGESVEEHRARMREYEKHKYATDPVYREKKRANTAKVKSSPEYLAKRREQYLDPAEGQRIRDGRRKYSQEKRAQILAMLGNPTHCGICGDEFVTGPDGRDPRCVDHRHDNDVIRGVICQSCNRMVATADLRYTDPLRWAATLAWSSKGEPVVATGRKRANKRRAPAADPVLFDAATDRRQ